VKNRIVLLATLVVIGSATRAVRGDERTLTGKISDSESRAALAKAFFSWRRCAAV